MTYRRREKRERVFRTGMYLLETLTSGMYNEPLSIYREYIQNAVDSIDSTDGITQYPVTVVRIELDPMARRVRISDNGGGIPAGIAEETLTNIGLSDKSGTSLRGFRGIGRLGGIAFCESAVFVTKARGEEIQSIQTWDCKELRELLSDPKKSSLKLKDLLKRITEFKQTNSKGRSGGYFEVTLEGVKSFRNYIFDIRKVHNYLAEVAPVPFDPQTFSYGKLIDEYLHSRLSRYGTYDIRLNGEPIYKPYKETIRLTKKFADKLIGIKTFEIKVKDTPLAYGWYGKRQEMLGSIVKGEGTAGIRVRIGNILLGDTHLLDCCFREPRFNSYLIGEIHVDHPNLIPNSRRDDFVDNETKALFYNTVEREIGLPSSKEIRLRSREGSKAQTHRRQVEREVEPPVCADTEKRGAKGRQPGSFVETTQRSDFLNGLISICGTCRRLAKVLSTIEGSN
jgi:molecular chaperone HtpG